MKAEIEEILLNLAELTKQIYRAEENQNEENQSALSDQLAFTVLEIRKRYEILSAAYLLSEVRASERYKERFENQNEH